HGQPHVEHALRCTRRILFLHRFRSAREDDAERIEFANLRFAHVERPDFAVHADLAHTARDQLGVLRSEVEDQDAAGVDVLVHANSGGPGGPRRQAGVSNTAMRSSGALARTDTAPTKKQTGRKAPSSYLNSSSPARIIRRFLGDAHIVYVALVHARVG